MPEHPPCLTPTLRRKSSPRSDLILFKCFTASSVREIAGAKPPAGTAETEAEDDRIERRLKRLKLVVKESDKGLLLRLRVEELVGKLKIGDEHCIAKEDAIFSIFPVKIFDCRLQ